MTLSRIVCLFVLGAVLLTANGCTDESGSEQVDKIGSAADFLFLTPEYQPGTYRNVDKIFPTRTFHKGATVYPLPVSDKPLQTVQYSPDGINTYDLNDFLRRNRVAGMLIIKDGEIMLERYAQGNGAQTRWTSFSVGKSVTSTLIGLAVQDGKLQLDDLVTQYLPQFQGTAYDGVTVKHLLQMSSGVAWNEDYRDPESDFSAMWQCVVEGRAGGILQVLCNLEKRAAPGTVYLYSTGETYLEGEVLRVALGGETLSSYLSRKIWANMGMEADGYWLLESPDGQEFAGGNLSMTLRDYGRFGLFMLNGGVVNGRQILPPDWLETATHPAADAPQCWYGRLYDAINTDEPYYYPLGYGYNWWALPDTCWAGWDGLDNEDKWGTDAITVPEGKCFDKLKNTFLAQGVFGQFIHVNPQEQLVTVVWSTWKDPWIDPKEYETFCVIQAATEALSEE